MSTQSAQSSRTSTEWTQVDDKTRRRILAHTPELMVVEVEFAAGGVGAAHTHPHVQATYVREGTFDFVVSGEPITITDGDSIVVPSNEWHGCETATGGTLIDVFTPAREDFLPST
ncbi:cupin domain-containing protein [Occultella aeris]|uniref:Cupin domain protein n=1 Tax=Occultella aeris TaxID=2761496 RepID=A0A7M4DQT9_9MICO|nr:cupin domain-containing protein [Occultella aeris]VZO39833.1 Cupin domain protein [Occultella aeris]